MATPVDPNYRARLGALGEKFAAGIPAVLDNITAALSHCRNADAGAETLERLHGLLHGVAGSAATFGYAEYGTRARALEQEVRPLLGKRPAEVVDFGALAERAEAFLAWARHDPKGGSGAQ